MTQPRSVLEQYKDGKYSSFVEAAQHSELHDHYLHHSVLSHVFPYLKDNSKVLDLACGNGILSRKIRRFNSSIETVGVDLSPDMLEKAKQLTEMEKFPTEGSSYLCSTVEELPVLGSFNAVISGFLISHLESRAKLTAVMNSISSNLCAGGIAVHSFPLLENLEEGGAKEVVLKFKNSASGTEEEIVLYDIYWSSQTLTDAAKEAGLVDIKIEPGSYSEGHEPKEAQDFKLLVLIAKKPLSE